MSESTQPFFDVGYPWAPANIATASRFYFAVEAARRINHKKPGGTIFAGVAFATDFVDGKVARAVERVAPGSGWGETKWGKIEHAADPFACVVIGSALTKSKQVHPLARAAAGLVVASESAKLGVGGFEVAAMVNAGESIDDITEYAQQIEISTGAKIAEAEKMGALVLGASTYETTSPLARQSIGGLALGLATHGSIQSAGYTMDYRNQLNALRAE